MVALALLPCCLVACSTQTGAMFVGRAAMVSFLTIHLKSAWILASVILLIFHVSGFYTLGRIWIYNSQHQSLVIFQAARRPTASRSSALVACRTHRVTS